MYSLNSIYICAVEVALRFLLCLRTLAISAMSTHGLVRTRFSLGSFTLSGNCSGFWFLVPVGLRIRIAVWTASVSNKHKNKLTYRLSINNDSSDIFQHRFLILSPVQEHSSIMSKSLQEMPNSRSWYRGGPKESQLLILVTSTDSLTKSSRMSIETSNCWSILFLPSREIKSFIKTSCCRSSTKLDDECKARRVIPLVYDFLLIRAESRQAGRPAASSPPGDLHQRPLHR